MDIKELEHNISGLYLVMIMICIALAIIDFGYLLVALLLVQHHEETRKGLLTLCLKYFQIKE